jgi:hypothetical protein
MGRVTFPKTEDVIARPHSYRAAPLNITVNTAMEWPPPSSFSESGK